jgi:hypothetical protein
MRRVLPLAGLEVRPLLSHRGRFMPVAGTVVRVSVRGTESSCPVEIRARRHSLEIAAFSETSIHVYEPIKQHT